MIEEAHVQDLRAALTRADFTVDAVFALLGDDAHRALGRNQTIPALRATERWRRPRHARATVRPAGAGRSRSCRCRPARIWSNRSSPPGCSMRPVVRSARSSTFARTATRTMTGGSCATRRPASTARQAPMNREYVLGHQRGVVVAGAADDPRAGRPSARPRHGLRRAGPPPRAARREVVATDVNPRALAMARLTAELNELDIDVRDGSLFDPVAGETFDLIATNPPFVISPPGQRGARLSRLRHARRQRRAASRRERGGTPQRRRLVPDPRQLGAPGRHALAGRTSRSGSPASRSTRGSLQRELVDPAEYVEMWLADAGLADSAGLRAAL